MCIRDRPGDVAERTLVVVDPMLATGGSSSAALSLLKEKGAKHIILMCLVAAPEGVRVINHDHPDVPLYVAAIDEKLNEKGYICLLYTSFSSAAAGFARGS